MVEERLIRIGDIQNFLLEGYEIDIDSPDGFIPVTDFVDKGDYDEYVLTTESGRIVRVNENHLFETDSGWKFAKDMVGLSAVLTDSGFELSSVVKTGNRIPIVDVQVDHENHRYYANGVSSHNTNVGKTLGLIDLSAGYVRTGLNVLYISAEMREELIMKRFDANMLKVAVNDVASLGKERFMNRIEVLKQKSYGKFKVKEFPPGAVTAVHIRNVVDELKLKHNFVPDIIVVDYLQITGSYRVKFGSVGSYYYYKAVAEELRSLAVELDVAIWSAAQFNRGGMNATEVGMEDVAESVGIMFTVDGAWGLIRTDELDQVQQIQWKQLKSRYADKAVRTRFVTGVDVAKQTFYDVSQAQQDEVSNPEGASRVTQDELREKFKTGRNDKPLNRFGDME